jgi:hypothetical protein
LEEHEFVSAANQDLDWHNMGIWTDTDYREINSELLVAQQINTFTGWICYAGVDHINIDFDGKIYGAQCQNDGALGHISDGLIFSQKPQTCKLQWCTCNTDIPIRKAKSADDLGLIGG